MVTLVSELDDLDDFFELFGWTSLIVRSVRPQVRIFFADAERRGERSAAVQESRLGHRPRHREIRLPVQLDLQLGPVAYFRKIVIERNPHV